MVKIINGMNGTRRTPAAKVIGSPIIGSHVNNKEILPHLLNRMIAFSKCCFFIGKYLWDWKRKHQPPMVQLMIAPMLFPDVATIIRNNMLYSSDTTIDNNKASDDNGIIVAAANEIMNKPI